MGDAKKQIYYFFGICANFFALTAKIVEKRQLLPSTKINQNNKKIPKINKIHNIFRIFAVWFVCKPIG